MSNSTGAHAWAMIEPFLVTLATAGVGGIGWFLKRAHERASDKAEDDRDHDRQRALSEAARADARDHHIDLLRIALDKGRVRENAAWTVNELLLVALELVPELPAGSARAKARAVEVLTQALATVQQINRGE